jgi:lactate dehydrogenase-like 2-hydroxyacid dehydrogenase
VKPKVLQNGRLLAGLEQALAAEFDVHPLWRETDRAAFLREHGARFEGLATSAGFGADAALIDALPNLRVIANFGVGYDTIDVEAARRRGIAVSNTPDVLNDCVADLAFGLVLDVGRGLSAGDRFVRRGDWTRGPFRFGTRVSGKKLGILGMGRIGLTVARRAGGFDMQIRYHNRRPLPDCEFGYETSLADLARWADFLVITAAGGAATRGLVSAAVLDALGPDGFLVNVARGSVVDEPALVQALRDKRIAGAALDVFVDEPNVPAELMALDNVVLLPHIASATHETRKAMGDLVFGNLREFFAHGRLVTPIPELAAASTR